MGEFKGSKLCCSDKFQLKYFDNYLFSCIFALLGLRTTFSQDSFTSVEYFHLHKYKKFHFISTDRRHVIFPAGIKIYRFWDPFPSVPLKIKISRLFKIWRRKNSSAIFFGFPYVDRENSRDYRKFVIFLLLIFCHGQLTLHKGLHRYFYSNYWAD
jgi:hypothetical protein